MNHLTQANCDSEKSKSHQANEGLVSASWSRYRLLGFYFSALLVVFSVLGIWLKGINFGIDFSGGYITEFSTSQSIDESSIRNLLDDKIKGPYLLAASDNDTYWTIREPASKDDNALDQNDIPLSGSIEGSISSSTSSSVSEKEPTNSSESWLKELMSDTSLLEQGIQIIPFDSDYIGTQIGEELINQGGLAMLTALIIIMLYLSTRFEWRFALGSIIALFHDVVFVFGLFAWSQLEFNLTVLASLLAVIGYSLNDSIIVADRIRELMMYRKRSSLSLIIDRAIKSTLVRTSITSGTTLATVGAVWWLAGAPLQGFSVALFGGILVGTFSSICISSTFPELTGLDVDYYFQRSVEAESEGDF